MVVRDDGTTRTQAGKAFMERVPNRSAATLKEVLIRSVLSGSIIYIDCWSGYDFGDLWEHYTVNHSLFFKDPDTGVCSNTIEGTSNDIKYSCATRCRTTSNDKVDLKLAEYLWKKRFGLNWIRLLHHAARMEYAQ